MKANSGTLATLLVGVGAALGMSACERPPPERPDFQFQLLAGDGSPIEEPTAPGGWACIEDLRTGLTWEAKSMEPGLHHRDNTYTWFSTDEAIHRNQPGVRDGGDCEGSRCDTEGFVEAVNDAGLCGYRDWRIADRVDFETIHDPTVPPPGPRAPTEHFPYMVDGEHWTTETYRTYPQGAWAWNMRYGHDRVDGKDQAKPVRLVRGTLVLNEE